MISRECTDSKAEQILDSGHWVNDIAVPAVLIDPDLRIVACSDLFFEWHVFGIADNHNVNDLPVVERKKVREDIQTLFAQGSCRSRIITSLTSNFEEQAQELNYLALLGQHKAIVGCVVHVTDVSQRYIERRQLLQSNDELTQLQYHLSHDLVAPIASAKGLLGLLKDDIADGRQDELAELAEETGQQLHRLDDLVKDLMSLARAGASVTELSQFDLRQMVDDIARSISLHTRVLETSITLDFEEAILTTDRVRVKQILTNLISNARKFTDPAEIAPEIVVTAQSVDGLMKICVSDNGLGVADNLIPDLFGMFVRGTSQFRGHGLGLYIVKRHVEQLNGTVQLLSPRKPTVFEVAIPHVGGPTP